MLSAAAERSVQKETADEERELTLMEFLCSSSVRESEKNLALKLIVEKAVCNKSEKSIEIFYLP